MKIKNHLTKFALAGSVFAIAGLGLVGCANSSKPVVEEVTTTTTTATSENAKTSVSNPDEAIALLKSGNANYVKGVDTTDISVKTRESLVSGQTPPAVVVTCSDSRVPAEEIFNAGLGEIFTIRTAGNVIDTFESGSVEYAVDHLGSKVVVVMGHSNCGAVGAAVDGHASGDIQAIVDEIKPAVDEAKKTETDTKAITSKAIDLNVMNSIAKLRANSTIKHLEDEGKIKIVGARYDLSTGEVSFFN